MKPKSLLSAIAVVVLSTSVGYAQRVESALIDGLHPVITCDAMPASAYTTTPKGNTEMLLKTATANEKVYKRFAVRNSDSSQSSWSNAFTACSGISGGLWRLPTQRELMLIWVLYPELKKISGFQLFRTDGGYRGATEVGSGSGWLVNFSNGDTGSTPKDIPYWVRCVREL